MMESYQRIWRIVGWTVFLFLVLLVPVWLYGGPLVIRSYVLGYIVSLVNVLFSLISIRWAFSRKIKTFYAVVMGGMAVRFILFTGIAFLVIAVFNWPRNAVWGFLLSFICFYLFLQYHEIRFITSELKGRYPANHDHPDS